MQLYNLPEEEMQDLITRTQDGDLDAQRDLLVVFSNFLEKYVNLLYHAKYDLNGSPETRKFLALYIADSSVRIPMLACKLDAYGYKKVQEEVRNIRFMVERYGSEEDVRQTIRMAFIHCVMNYVRKDSKTHPGEYTPFAGYIGNYFRFIMKRYVDHFLIDQHGRKSFRLLPDEADPLASEGEGPENGYRAPPTDALEEVIGPDIIDEYWVAGDTAFFPFDTLTMQERQLIRWRYAENIKASAIAHIITEHPNTLREHFVKIKEKLEGALAES